MILVDTSVWIDHLRASDTALEAALKRNEVLVHPWVIGELALGNLRNRAEVLLLLGTMPQAPVIEHEEALALIANEKLYGLGIGLVDIHLLASAHATAGTTLWTRDRRLGRVAEQLALRFDEAPGVKSD